MSESECVESEVSTSVNNRLQSTSSEPEINSENLILDEPLSTSSSIRLPKLRKAIDSTVQKCISGIRYRKFAESLEMLQEPQHKDALKRVYAQLKDQLAASISTEVDLLLSQEKVPDLLAELENCIKESRVKARTEAAWRPKGNPADDLAAHKISTLMTYREKLKQLLSEEERECDRKRVSVAERRMAIDTKLKAVGECHRKHQMACSGVQQTCNQFSKEKENDTNEKSCCSGKENLTTEDITM